jgi:hypothetical protein
VIRTEALRSGGLDADVLKKRAEVERNSRQVYPKIYLVLDLQPNSIRGLKRERLDLNRWGQSRYIDEHFYVARQVLVSDEAPIAKDRPGDGRRDFIY